VTFEAGQFDVVHLICSESRGVPKFSPGDLRALLLSFGIKAFWWPWNHARSLTLEARHFATGLDLLQVSNVLKTFSLDCFIFPHILLCVFIKYQTQCYESLVGIHLSNRRLFDFMLDVYLLQKSTDVYYATYCGRKLQKITLLFYRLDCRFVHVEENWIASRQFHLGTGSSSVVLYLISC
jgi:hypothetical protein